MTIHLSGGRDQTVRSFMETGRYASEDEVIDEALRLLEERDERDKLESLRREVAIGIEQVARGGTGPFDPHGTLARVRSQRSPNEGGG